jgi:hypothetical protein
MMTLVLTRSNNYSRRDHFDAFDSYA